MFFSMLLGMFGCTNSDNSDIEKLSQMSEEDCVNFIKSRNIKIPDDFDNEKIGSFIKEIIIDLEEDPEKMYVISYSVAFYFIEEIREAVIDYYENN